jgi:hypothetical protein
MSNFTPEHLIAYHYGELSPTERQEIEFALSQSWPLQEKYKVITEASSLLNKGLKSPGWRSIQSVLNHAQPASFPLEMLEN